MSKSSEKKPKFYQEFGNTSHSEAFERPTPELPPNHQNIKVQASRAGRKGKTVTIITGFVSSPETLAELLKQIKTQCGSGGTIKDSTIEIQGDHRTKIVSILTELGYKVKISGG